VNAAPTEHTTATGPLTGMTVLEFATNAAGPLCTQFLSDLGADVIKVESRQGDPVRHTPPFHRGESGLFAQFNGNKRSIGVDLTTPTGRNIARRLAQRADVLVENARAGVLDKLGLGFAELRPDNPKLVYLSINGYGDDGPYRDMPAYDQVIQGLTGFAYQQGGDGPPALIRAGIVDKTASVCIALGRGDLLDDPQVRHNQSYVDFPDPELGAMRLINPFAAFSAHAGLDIPASTPARRAHRRGAARGRTHRPGDRTGPTR
jgi:crotonobetainyl-CoA:carnitine CoA-transferase CaiB-like acyl-CoA transferase